MQESRLEGHLGDQIGDDGLALRVAAAADVGAVVALVESAYRGESSRAGWTTEADLLGGQRTDAAAVTATVADERSALLLLHAADGRLLGCAQIGPVEGGVCHFGMFAVRPDRQAAGLGRRLLAAAEAAAARAFAARTMEMTVIAQRGELIGWYERRGYRRTGETRPFPYGDERFGRPRRGDLRFAVLRKDLPPAGGPAPGG